MKHSAHGRGVTGEAHAFSQIPAVQMERSSFNRSHGLKTTFDAGLLIPIFWDEALPGDTFNLKMSTFCRMSTPIFPVMDNLFMDFFFFAVPNRLLWVNWEKFCGAQDNPGESTDFLIPLAGTLVPTDNSIADYFGLPKGMGNMEVNALHFRAYNKIYNEWFRDENLQDSLNESTDDGPDNYSIDYGIVRRGKRHDYFTSCLPFTQKGTAVTLPIGSVAPVVSTGDGIPIFDGASWAAPASLTSKGTGPAADWTVTAGTAAPASWDTTRLEADLSAATGATINTIRQAFQIQRLLERDARGGTRYTEIIRAHFGVTSPDARLQRSEYLGGGTTKINIHPVSATSDSGTRDVGQLAAFGTQMSSGIGFTKSFTEHCILIGLVNVRADLSYQQGIERMWSRQTRFDFYWPALSHIGEQAVLNKEIFHSDNDTIDNATFGFQERYAEYKHKLSRITGDFASNAVSPLDSWHLALDFASLPALNTAWIEDNPPVDRVLAIPAEPHFIGDFYFDLICARPMPTFSIPGMIDHF